MKSKFTWFFTMVLVMFVQIGFAQTKQVSGIVKDTDGFPLEGVSVEIVGTSEGISTDEDGAYKLNVKVGDKISVSMLGYKTQVMTVGTSTVLNVTLPYDDEGEELGGIVIDSYRTIASEKSNTASSVVSSKTIEGRPNASFLQTLQGQVPGLNISTGSGQPGSSNTSVILRGIGSINGNVEPLYVVDGVQMNGTNFRSINPNDIENVTVLKDAGATSIYGNRGANGVIVVTTKRANFEQDLQIKYVGQTSVSTVQKHKYNLMNSQELMAFQKELGMANWSDQQIKGAVNSNWLDHFFRQGIGQSHTLSFASGSSNLGQFTSIGFNQQEGIIRNTDLKRFNFRNNLNGRSKDKRLTFSTGINFNYSRSNEAFSLGRGLIYFNPVVMALMGLPYVDIANYDPNDPFGSIRKASGPNDEFQRQAPLIIEDNLRSSKFYTDEIKAILNGSLNYELGRNFSTGVTLGVDYTDTRGLQYESPKSFLSQLRAEYDEKEYDGNEISSFGRVVSFNPIANLKWGKEFEGGHELRVGAYTEYLRAFSNSARMSREGLAMNFSYPNSGIGEIQDNEANDHYVPTTSKSAAKSGLFSYLASLDYDYNTRYGFSATVRRDASFRFSEVNRWGTFWSVSGRWNLDREDFLKNSETVSALKFRASYGTAGNQDILGTGLFGAASMFRTRYSLSGANYMGMPSIYLSGIPNVNLRWETIAQANVGVDFGLWNNRLRGTVDVYQKTTNDLFQSRPVSAIHATTSINDNIGSMRNRGVELILAGDVVRKENLRITLNANGSYNKNQIIKLASPDDRGAVWGGGLQVLREGDSYGQWYLVKYAGVDPKDGNLLFYDKDGNKVQTFTDKDRVFTGKSTVPVYQGSFGLDAEYKGWFVNANFTFVKDIWRMDYDYSNIIDFSDAMNYNKSADLLGNYWTTEGQDALFPRLEASNAAYDSMSDRDLRDASYLRLRYLSVGYNFQPKDLIHLKLQGLRIFAQAENLKTWTKWKGWDAESNRASDAFQYPTPKTVSFGVEVSF